MVGGCVILVCCMCLRRQWVGDDGFGVMDKGLDVGGKGDGFWFFIYLSYLVFL